MGAETSVHVTAERYGPWALVAGASEGIGAAFAERLAARGIHLVLVARRQGPLAGLSDRLAGEHGVETRALTLDLSEPGIERELFAATADLTVGLVVYNAGAAPADHFLDRSAAEWAAMVNRNCTVPLLCAHHYGASMVARGHGGLVMVTSGAAWAGGARLATYAGTKAFDLVFGESLWAEWGPLGVDVLSLVVNSTDTPALRRFLAERGRSADGLADPDTVAAEGLEHLGDGPTWGMGMGDMARCSPLGSLDRGDAVVLIGSMTDELFGPRS
jgi:short-subunit dehydrogenase